MSELFKDAQAELTDMRKVRGRMGMTAAEKAAEGRTHALEYLTAELTAVHAYGETLLSAVFAAVGPQHFEVSAAGMRLLADVVGSDPRPEEDEPAGADTEFADNDHGDETETLFDDPEDVEDGDDEMGERDGEVELHFPDRAWERLAPHLTVKGDAARIVEALAATDRTFLLRCVYIAAQLASSDSLRKHL